MSQVCVIFPLFVLFSIRLVYGFPGDNVMLIPQSEVRNVDPYLTHPSQPNTFQFQANRNKPQQVLNTDVMHRRQPQVPETEKPSNQNMTFGELREVLNEAFHQSQHREEELQRHRAAASTGRNDNQAYPTLPRPMGEYSRPNYAPPATYHETAAPTPLTPPSSAQPKISLLKPDFPSFMAPVTTKASSKFSGLIGLILSLLHGSSSGSHISALKDFLVEGIVKPLFVSKGGLKMLISKFSVPLISLMFINMQVLITIWWLWEDCSPVYFPEPAYYTPTYSKPPSAPSYDSNSNYNSYR